MTPLAATRGALDALDAAGDLGAVVDRNDDDVLARAEVLERAGGAGTLAGRTMTVKDWIDASGFACEGEHRERAGRRPDRDASVVARIRRAGAVVVAKTQPGSDHPIHGRCHHPLDPSRTPGGSSSGEAALIGRGASSVGLGSDSGGSVRLPAAWCGVVGFKPSFGSVPSTGHYPRVGGHVDGRTVIGPMATSVADAALVWSVISGPDGVDPSCVPVVRTDPSAVSLAGLRVAVVADDPRWPVADTTRDATERAVRSLEHAGAVIVDVPVPLDLSESLDITQRYWNRSSLSGGDAERQLWEWDRYSSRLLRAATEFDVVVGPVVGDVAPPHRPLVGEDYVFTLPWSLTGWPAISLPMGADPATGLPLAAQIVAPSWGDSVVLAAATAIEDRQSRW